MTLSGTHEQKARVARFSTEAQFRREWERARVLGGFRVGGPYIYPAFEETDPVFFEFQGVRFELVIPDADMTLWRWSA